MKRMKLWVLAATLICGASVFTACSSSDDNPVVEQSLSEKIIGKWVVADLNGQPAETNMKSVYNFVSATKAYVSASFSTLWSVQKEVDVAISGNNMTLTHHPDENTKLVEEYTVTAINDKEFTAIHNVAVTVDSEVKPSYEATVRFTKVTVDYSDDILGMWEGRMTSEESKYGDVENHRWEYNKDNTYSFWMKNDKGEWVASEDDYSDYFVAGNLLCTRWKNSGEGQEEQREWWEIAIEDGVMKWTALRQREDGTTYTATFEMTKAQ